MNMWWKRYGVLAFDVCLYKYMYVIRTCYWCLWYLVIIGLLFLPRLTSYEKKMRSIAPSQLPDSRLCFEALTADTDWQVPRASIPLKDVKKTFSSSMSDTLEKMSTFLREGTCEQALYPRVSFILLESIHLYRSLIPKGMEMLVHPSLTFIGKMYRLCCDHRINGSVSGSKYNFVSEYTMGEPGTNYMPLAT